MKSEKNNRPWRIIVRCYRRNKFPKTDGYGWLDDYVETVLDNTELRTISILETVEKSVDICRKDCKNRY